MPHTIRIRENEPSTTKGEFNAMLSFDHGSEYPIRVSDPFAGTDQEATLEWYFEEWLTFPFTNTVKAENAAASVRSYGEALFAQVFKGNADAYADYRVALNNGDLRDSHIEIAGSPDFHALHWEALHDPQQPEPLVTSCTLVRKNLKPLPIKAVMREADSIRVLVVTARPFGDRDVGYRTISRPLINALRDAKLNVAIDLLRPATYRALREQLEQKGVGYYHVLHFDTHGALMTYKQFNQIRESSDLMFLRWGRGDIQPYEGVRGYVFFEKEASPATQSSATKDNADAVQAGELAALLQQFQVPMVVLNACQSGKQVGEHESSLGSRLMQAGVQNVLAMGYSVTVSAATKCMTALYQQLFEGQDLQHSLRRARVALRGDKTRRAYFDQRIQLEDWLLPVMYENTPAQLKVRQPNAAELNTQLAREQGAVQFAAPTYGFFGRDLDILRVERLLMDAEGKMQPLLIYGMGGMGKSTLLRHLAGWWVQTGWAQRVFYYGWDAKAWTRQQIMHDIAQAVLDAVQYRSQFLPLDEEQQQAFLSRLLRRREDVLILDNLESVQAAQGDTPTASAALKHSLSAAEQQKLQGWVTALRGGKTRVLLGSRGREDWLCKHAYALGGLDAEAASELAEAVLRQSAATVADANRPELQRLLKLLAGVPLALEVILPNLKQQSAQAVLAALTEGNVQLDSKGSDTGDKTKSILRCIEYSHQQVPPELQDLLACLAPFVGIVDLGLLVQYTDHLKEQPELTGLPFERWHEALELAKRWGLLSVHLQSERHLQLQPVLPYFLRSHLAGTPARRAAIERAFYELYSLASATLNQLTRSKQAEEQSLSLGIIEMEYENISAALSIGLANHASIISLHNSLNLYLDHIQDHGRGLALAQRVQTALAAYPATARQGQFEEEFMGVLDNVANRYSQVKRYADAEQAYKQVLDLYKALKNDEFRRTFIAGTYSNLGMIAQAQQKWGQAERYYQQALHLFIESNERYWQANTHHNLGNIAAEQRQSSQAEQHYQQALQLFIECNERYAQAKTYHNLGIIAQDHRQWAQAERYYQQALQIQIEFDNRYAQASTYGQLGAIAQEQRQWAQSERYYQQALQIQIEFNDRYAQASIYGQLGVMAQAQQQWVQAEQYSQQALQLFIEFKDLYSQATMYQNLGIIAQAQQQWARAEQYSQQALQLFIEFKDRYSQATTYLNLGNIAQAQQQWAQAERHYQQGLQLFTEFKDLYSQASTHHNLGIMAHEQRQWAQAEQHYQQALQLFIECNERYRQAGTYHQLGRVAQAKRQWAQAKEFLLKDLVISLEFNDTHGAGITIRSLARLWHEGGDESLPAAVGAVLGASADGVRALFTQALSG